MGGAKGKICKRKKKRRTKSGQEAQVYVQWELFTHLDFLGEFLLNTEGKCFNRITSINVLYLYVTLDLKATCTWTVL